MHNHPEGLYSQYIPILKNLGKLYPSKVVHNSGKTQRLFFLTVEIKPSILAYISAPLKVRKQFDIFRLTLAGLMSLSARLFVNGTSLLKANASTASFSLMRRSTRFLPLVRLYLPFLPVVFMSGGSAFSPIPQMRSYLDSMYFRRLTLSSKGIM